MNTRKLATVLLSLVVGFLPSIINAALNLVEVKSIEFAYEGRPINQIAFRDIDQDGHSELLYCTSRDLVLYSLSSETVLYEIDYDSAMAASGVLTSSSTIYVVGMWLGDVNRDGASDAALLLATDWFSGPSSGLQFLLFIDNLLDPGPVVSVTSYSGRYGGASQPHDGVLTAADLNDDGYEELIVAVDSISEDPTNRFPSAGRTIVYRSFPEIAAVWPFQISRHRSTPIEDVGGMFLASVKSRAFVYDPIVHSDSRLYLGYLALINGDGEILHIEADTLPLMCHGTSLTSNVNELNFQCSGNLIPSTTESEVVASYFWGQECWDSVSGDYDTMSFRDYGNELIMYKLVPPASLEEVWRRESLRYDYRCCYHLRFPGHFFAFSGNTRDFLDLSSADGSILDVYTDLPFGGKRWLRPFGEADTPTLGPDYLVVFNEGTIRIFGIDAVTGVEAPTATLLPSSFTLGQPYPNPFNPTVCVPITVGNKGPLKVEVYNPLGQRVAILHDRVASPGELVLLWDASDFGSGVYLIRATLGEDTRTVKAVLVK